MFYMFWIIQLFYRIGHTIDFIAVMLHIICSSALSQRLGLIKNGGGTIITVISQKVSLGEIILVTVKSNLSHH